MKGTLKEHLRRFGLRFALGGLRKLATADKSGAALLSERRRQGSVALVWALDQDGERLSDEAMAQLDKLSDFDTVAVVCPPRYFSALRSMGLFFETLPQPEDIARSGISCDWELYLSRRIGRIRSSWAPDFEFTVGLPPLEYLDRFQEDA